MSEIKLYETYNTVRNIMEHGWLDVAPIVSPVDGTAIRTSVTSILDTATLNNSQTVNTNTNLTNIQLNKIDISTGNVTLQLPDITNNTYTKAFYFIKVENIDTPATHTVTILPFSGQFIRDPYDDTQKSSISLTFASNAITLFNLDGTDWQTNAFSIGSTPQAISNTTITTNIVTSDDNNLKYTGLNYVDLKSNKIINLLNPTTSSDAATKNYVDSQFVNGTVMHNIVTVSSSNAQYTSINTALSSITTNSVSNPYVIQVGPGNYIETTITMKPYVDIVGSGVDVTTITASSTTQTIIIGTPNSLLSNIKLTGASGTGGKAVTCTNFASVISFRLENVFFGSNDMHMEVSATTGLTMVRASSCSLGGTDNFNTGFYIHSTSSSFPAVLSCDSMSYLDITTPYSNIWFRVVGLGGQLSMNNSVGRITASTGTSTAIQAEEGSEVRINGCTFKGFISGIYSKLAGTNTGPRIYALGCYLENATWNVNIENSATTGFINTNQNAAKVFIPDASTFYIAGKDSHIINVSKTGGEYSSIFTALATITDSSATDRYVINIGPGIYNEPLLDMTAKPYVSIVGCVIQSTVIKPITSTQNIFKIGTYNELSFLWLEGVGSGYSAVLVDDGGNYSQMHKVTFNDCDTGVKITSTSVDTQFYGEYLDMNGAFSYAVKCISTSTALTTVNLENFYVFPTVNNAVGLYITGTNTHCDILTSGMVAGAYTNTKGLIAENGADVTLNSCYFIDWVTAISIPNTGSAPNLSLSSISFENNTTDLSILHASTTGNLTGNSHIDKITNNSPAFAWNFIDNETGALEITNKLNITFDDGVNTDLSTLITQGSPMGVLNGGVITVVSGLQINISAGDGYVDDPTVNSVTVKKIIWSSSNLTLPANQNNFIYFNYAGTLSYSTSEPNAYENIMLGRVVTYASNVLLIDAIPFTAHHMSNRTESGVREAFGAIYNTGSLVVENATAYHLDVGSGIYYYGNTKFSPSGGTNITFKQFYRDDSGGWIISSVSAVDSTHFDDNSGTLATLGNNNYAKHSLYIVGELTNEQYLLVIGQTEYATLVDAEGGSLSSPPSYFVDGIVLIANIIVKKGRATIYEIQDARPVVGFKATGVSATATHGNLLGLSADDHPQYLLVSGTRSMGGDLNMNTNNITNVGTINNVDIATHASRHLPNGSDPLTTDAPSTIGTSNTEGTANSFARSDHVHSHGAQTDPSHHAIATTTTAGFMSAADKVILDNLGTPDHSTLLHLTADDHPQYLNINGRTGGQTIIGGTAASNNLTLNSTSNITKGSIVINESTNSTSTTTGALVLNGTGTGLGMTGNLYVGGNIVASSGTITVPTIYGSSTTLGNVTLSANSADATGLITIGSALATFTNSTDATTPTAAGVTFAGGIGVSKKIRVADTTASTSTITGSIITAGGLGVADSIFTGSSLNAATSVITPTVSGSTVTTNNLTIRPNTADLTTGQVNFTNTTDASSSTVASTAFAGGIGVAKKLNIGDTTASTSTTTGSLITAGGLGVAGNSFYGGTMNIAGITTLTSATASTSTATGALVLSGANAGLGVAGAAFIGTTLNVGTSLSVGTSLNVTTTSTLNGITTITSATASTSTATGALVLSGANAGLGVAGAAFIGTTLNAATSVISPTVSGSTTTANNLTIRPNTADLTTGQVNFTNTTTATSTTVASATFSGGVGIAGNIRIGSATAATSTTTGSLITAGGLGVAGNSFYGGTMNIAGITTLTSATASTSAATGALVLSGASAGLGVAGAAFIGTTLNAATSVISPTVSGSTTTANNLTIRPNTADLTTGQVNFTNTTTATSTTVASATFSGGVGIAGNIRIGSATAATSTTTGSLITAGGLGVAGNSFYGGTMNIAGITTLTSATASTSAATGALVLSGVSAGLGVAGAAFIGTTLNAATSVISPTVSGSTTTTNSLTIRPNTADLTTGQVNFTNTTTATSTSAASAVFSGGIGIADNIRIGSIADSTSTATGSIITAGGLGVASAAFIGTTLNAATSVISPTVSGSTTTANNLTIRPNTADLTTGQVNFTNTTTATSTTVASATFSGGVGIAGNIRIGSATAATSTTTGSLITAGGLGVAGNSFYGGTMNIAGITTLTSATASTSAATGALVLSGASAGLGVAGAAFIGTTLNAATSVISPTVSGSTATTNSLTIRPNTADLTTGQVNFTNTTTATSTSVASAIFSGGVGIADNLRIGSTAAATSTITGSLITAGGLGVAGNSFYGGTMNIAGITTLTSATASTSAATGALVLSGASAGLGVAGAAFIGTTLNAATSVISPTVSGSTTTANNLTIRPNTADLTTGQVNFTNTTDATSSTTASATFAGGVGIAKKLNVADTTTSTSTSTGSIVTAGGLGVAGNSFYGGTMNIAGITTITSATASTSTSTGALVLSGVGAGLGVAGAIYCDSFNANTFSVTNTISSTIAGSTITGNNLTIRPNTADLTTGQVNFTNTTDATSSTTASATFAGGIGVTKKIIVGNTTDSTSTSTGSIVTAGGLGVAKSIYCNALVAGNVNIDTTADTINNTTVNTDLSILTNGTGRVAVSGDPTANLHVSTKQYVDNLFTRIAKYKTADLTRNNTNNTAADNELTGFSVVPGTYIVKGTLFTTCITATPGFRMKFTATTTTVANFKIGINKYIGTATNTLLSSISTIATFTVAASELNFINFCGTVEFTTANGTFGLDWAQSASSGNNTTLQRGSFMQMQRIA